MNFTTKNIAVFAGLVFLFCSCTKQKIKISTADFQGQFKTYIKFDCFASHKTRVKVFFYDPNAPFHYDVEPSNTLKLPPGTHLKINGEELNWVEFYTGYGFYQYEFDGKPICAIEFKDLDGTVYKNTVIPPDTAYFIGFPDTVTLFEDLTFQVNAPNLDSNESHAIYLDGNGGDYYTYAYFGKDTIITMPHQYLEPRGHYFEFNRIKQILNPNLPPGGGDIVYHYRIDHFFPTQ